MLPGEVLKYTSGAAALTTPSFCHGMELESMKEVALRLSTPVALFVNLVPAEPSVEKGVRPPQVEGTVIVPALSSFEPVAIWRLLQARLRVPLFVKVLPPFTTALPTFSVAAESTVTGPVPAKL